jgi:sugar lactone lactonase YvrE
MKMRRSLIHWSNALTRRIHRVGMFALGMSLLPAAMRGQANYTPYAFSTLAGWATIGSNDGAGANARFYEPTAVAVDGYGTIYVADTQNHTIRRIDAGNLAAANAGYVSTLAGMAGVSGAVDGAGSAARFNSPEGVAVTPSGGALYVADTGNHTVRKAFPLSSDLEPTITVAGAAGEAGSADGIGTAARFNRPCAVAVDAAGNVYVADGGNRTIRKITPGGLVTTLAGLAGADGDADGTGSAARFSELQGLAADPWGNLYATDDVFSYYGRLRRITPAGEVTTVQNNAILYPQGVAADAVGNLYLSDSLRILRLTSDGQATTLSTLPTLALTSAPRWVAPPDGIAVDALGNVVVADTEFSSIRRVSPGGVMTTIAGASQPPYGAADGPALSARFHTPVGVGVDAAGNVFVADSVNNTIRRISTGGVVTTLAGLAGTSGSADGVGSVARFSDPEGLAVDAQGRVYVTDLGNWTVRRIAPDGVVTTLAGLAGVFDAADGTGSEARFEYPTAIAVDGAGTAYVADVYAVRKISPTGAVTTLAGVASAWGFEDGTGSAARFDRLEGIAVDAPGNVYVTDEGAHTIRKISPAGVVTTLAGMARVGGDTDGTGTAASFLAPGGLAVDAGGTLYVADVVNATIRKVTPQGVVATLAGLTQSIGSADGVGSIARFNMPGGVAIDNAGRLLVADSGNHTIRVGTVATAPVIVTPPRSVTAAVGSQVQFTVVVSANPTPRYQWFHNTNGAPIIGGTGPTVTLAPVAASMAGTYFVLVTNDVGSVTSESATLTVTPGGSGSSAGGGGGAVGGWFVMALAMLAVGRWADGGVTTRRFAAQPLGQARPAVFLTLAKRARRPKPNGRTLASIWRRIP